IVIGEKIKLANYRPPKETRQDRVFLALQIKGAANAEGTKIPLLRRAGYPVATLSAPSDISLSQYMQFVHYAVCGLGILRKMNFVTQPSVELYKSITGRVYAEAEKAGGIERTRPWQAMLRSPQKANWGGALTLFYDHLEDA